MIWMEWGPGIEEENGKILINANIYKISLSKLIKILKI